MIDSSTVYIRHVASSRLVPAVLQDGIEDQQLQDWDRLWRPAQQELIEHLRATGAPRNQWPQTAHWNWAKKIDLTAGLLAYRSLCIVCDTKTQALMRLDVSNRRSRIAATHQLNLVFIEYLETAPWNQRSGPQQYEGLGSLLVGAAVQISIDEGFAGRIGLHSLPQADGFYQRIGMTDLGQDPDCHNLHYFEFTPTAAQHFQKGRSQP